MSQDTCAVRFAPGCDPSKVAFLGPPADYLKGCADRRVAERVLGIWAIRVSAEDAPGATRPSFECGWVGASKSEIYLKVVRWGSCRAFFTTQKTPIEIEPPLQGRCGLASCLHTDRETGRSMLLLRINERKTSFRNNFGRCWAGCLIRKVAFFGKFGTGSERW